MSDPTDTNPHDHLIRELLSNPEQGAAYLASVLPPPIADAYDLSRLRRVPSDFVTSRFKERRADMLLHVPRRGEPADSDDPGLYLYLLFEHLSGIDQTLPLRVLEYEVASWYDIVKSQGGDPRHRRLRLPPILPLVLYHGEATWTVPADMQSVFGLDTLPAVVREALEPYVVSQRYVLQDLGHTPDEEITGRRSVRIALVVMKHVRSSGDPLEALRSVVDDVGWVLNEGGTSDLHGLEMVVYYLMITSDRVDEQQILDVMQPLGERAKEVVMTAGERLIEKGRQEGRQEGERDARLKLARKMLARGLSAAEVAEIAELSQQDIEKLSS